MRNSTFSLSRFVKLRKTFPGFIFFLTFLPKITKCYNENCEMSLNSIYNFAGYVFYCFQKVIKRLFIHPSIIGSCQVDYILIIVRNCQV